MRGKTLLQTIPLSLALALTLHGVVWADAATPAQGGRYALVIGNSDYGGGDDDVSGAMDAEIVAKALSDLGFTTVIKIQNGNLDAMNTGLSDLAAKIGSASVVVVYFSGHGFQDEHDNYLIPARGAVDPSQSISLTAVKNALASAPLTGSLKLVFLDACRTLNPSSTAKQGFNEKTIPPLPNTLFEFAAGFNLTAPAGDPKGFSPFTFTLVRHIREPGLDLDQLLGKVKQDLALSGQVPVNSANFPLSQFLFREPVIVTAKASNGSVIAILNGKVVLAAGQTTAQMRLDAGDNDLVVMVSNPKAYHNGHTWERTSGWSYSLDLAGPGGALNCPEAAGGPTCFTASEEVPFKDGPHHGNVFVVARANLSVSPDSAAPEVSLKSADTTVWNREAPLNAQDQKKLFEEKVKDLPLDRILDPAKFPDFGVVSAAFLVPLLRDLLTTGNLLGQQVADPDRTFFVVYGNKILADFVRTCVQDRMDARIADLQASVAAALKREATPFTSFDQQLTACVREVGKAAATDLGVWTAIEDRSNEATAAGPAASTQVQGGGR